MAEERITEINTPDGDTHTRTTVIRDAEPSSGGGKWVLLVILLVLAAGALFIFSQMSDAEVAKDGAVAGAAEDVGNAASQVGDAAQEAADSISE
ncbi:MAG: hypothetical protein JY451_14805 [Erythrobacter sp.]|nr:MAG: hypothetical protein JY451_14805 [Erythrobacter sp.]